VKKTAGVVIAVAAALSFVSCEKSLTEIPGDEAEITGYIWVIPADPFHGPQKYRAADGEMVSTISDFTSYDSLHGYDADPVTGESFYLIRSYNGDYEYYLAKYSSDSERLFTAPMPEGTWMLQFDPFTKDVWSFNWDEDRLYKFSGKDGALLSEIEVGGEYLDIRCYDVYPSDGSVWVLYRDTLNDKSFLVNFDKEGAETLRFDVEGSPETMEVAPDSGDIWLGHDSGWLLKYDSDGSLEVDENVSGDIRSLTVVPSGEYLSVNCWDSLKLYDVNGDFISAWPYFGAGTVSFHTSERLGFVLRGSRPEDYVYSFTYPDWSEQWSLKRFGISYVCFVEK
jgi:hypothetical protein